MALNIAQAGEAENALQCARKLVQRKNKAVLAESYLTHFLDKYRSNQSFSMSCPRARAKLEPAEVSAADIDSIKQVISTFQNLTYTCRLGLSSAVVAALVGFEVGLEGEICTRSDGKRWLGAGISTGVGVGLAAAVSASADVFTNKGTGNNPFLLSRHGFSGMIVNTPAFGENELEIAGKNVTHENESELTGSSLGASPFFFFYFYATVPQIKGNNLNPTNLIIRTKVWPLKSDFSHQFELLKIKAES